MNYNQPIFSYTYILECSNGAFYIGSTKDLSLRLEQYNTGVGSKYTKKHLPVKLVYFEEFNSLQLAFFRERQLKGWTRRKKMALIESQANKLIEYSKNYSEFGHPDFRDDKKRNDIF